MIQLLTEPATTQDSPPGSGTPYHLLGRTGSHRWWRPWVEMVLLLVLAVVTSMLLFGAVIGLALVSDPVIGDDLRFADPLWDFGYGFAAIGALLPLIALTVRWIGKRRPGSVSSVAGRLRWGWLLHCLGWALLAIGLAIGADLLRGADWDAAAWPGWPTFFAVLVLALALIPFQAAAEEYLCRGWLVQTISSWTRTPWPGVVISSLVFTGLHDHTEPWVLGEMFLFAIALCWLTLRTGGLEAAIALHVVNNVVLMVLESTQGMPDLNQAGGDYALWDVLPVAITTLLYTWWVDRQARRRGLATTTR
ncbi:CPBP family intramembrane metalloprotease [Saccharopolyspora indica]|uniref:CPBP family intramembrane glutamic endopeptidase n=1 Tax=Saccharopolyspora indica TaxID=1229659 RepID=UPI0022EACD66|nr:type II CAAX endopeptidase family protein [Saccharopolyspora indica]MDA3642596.1 type II CAAX endopeptidase family protein [Saccharopolyspora indica]